MIDNEYKVFNTVKTAITTSYSTAFVSGDEIRVVPTFPAITIVQKDNSVYKDASTLSNIEVAVNTMYEINVYTNIENGKKKQAKDIMGVIDTTMLGMGYIRDMCSPMENLNDATIYRLVARYTKIEI